MLLMSCRSHKLLWHIFLLVKAVTLCCCHVLTDQPLCLPASLSACLTQYVHYEIVFLCPDREPTLAQMRKRKTSFLRDAVGSVINHQALSQTLPHFGHFVPRCGHLSLTVVICPSMWLFVQNCPSLKLFVSLSYT